jgi:hypothetical protein
MSNSQPTEATLRALAIVVEQLEPHGWTATPTVFGARFRIGLEHPLTSVFALNFENSDEDHSDFVARTLRHREFRMIEARPAEIPHASLIQKVRSAAQFGRWDPDVVELVARILRSESLLTDAEAEWLEMAGRAWMEDEGD